MRGASALDQLLAEFPQADLLVQVVWEPVLKTDIAAPLTGVLALAKDRRVNQYWDPGLLLSADLVRAANSDPGRYGLEEPFPPDSIAWDLVAVFSKSARWEPDPPVPSYYGGPVVNVIEETRKALSAELASAVVHLGVHITRNLASGRRDRRPGQGTTGTTRPPPTTG